MWKQISEKQLFNKKGEENGILKSYEKGVFKKEITYSKEGTLIFFKFFILNTPVFRKRIIQRNDGAPYLIRYYILRTPWFRIRLHNILLSDYDCLHDHPWNFLSIVLWNGYDEIFNDKPIPLRHKAPKILYRKAEDRHRLIVNKPAWTLVFMFKRRRQWGFFTKKGWKFWEDYVPTQTCE